MIQELILLVALMASAAIALEKISLKISEQESKLLRQFEELSRKQKRGLS